MVTQAGSGEVRTWIFPVSDALPFYDRLFALLSEQEQTRAGRFLPRAAREEFVVARGCLRLLLGHQLGTSAAAIPILDGAYGKPSTPGVHFNVSHASGLVAIALSTAGAVGIDIEHEDRTGDVLEVAGATFSQEELTYLYRASTPQELRRRFFMTWTSIEARAKCLGLGLTHLEAMRDSNLPFAVTSLRVPSGYHGALCRSGAGSKIVEGILSNEAIENLLSCR